MYLKHVPDPSVVQRSLLRAAYRTTWRTRATIRARLGRVDAHLHRCDGGGTHVWKVYDSTFVDHGDLYGVHCYWYAHRPSRYAKWYADEDPSVSSNSSLVTLLEYTHSIGPLRDPLLDHRPCRQHRPTYASEARAEGHGRR
jgi:hypothetical protein